MPDYMVEFVCTRNGLRTDGALPASLEIPIPSLAAAQQRLTASITATLAQQTGDRITDLTITNIQIA